MKNSISKTWKDFAVSNSVASSWKIDEIVGTDIWTELDSFFSTCENFTPMLLDIFKCFGEFSFDQLNGVILGQDPYPIKGEAVGLAFVCYKARKRSQTRLQKALRKDKIDVFARENGILMLNLALTVEVRKTGSHIDIWNRFTQAVLSHLLKEKSNICVWVMGRTVEERLRKNIDLKDPRITLSMHPAARKDIKELEEAAELFLSKIKK